MRANKDAFHDRLALITGGSSGIGFALAKQLIEAGARVWLVARRKELLDSAVNALEKMNGNKAGAVVADVSDWEQARTVIEKFQNEVGTPDLLINSAGAVEPGYVDKLSLDQYRLMMNVNYFGTVHAVKASLPAMLKRGSGRIVNISSPAGYVTGPGYGAYSPSKYAVRAFSDVLRSELKPQGLKVSVVFPPDTDTPQLAYEKSRKTPELAQLQDDAGIGPIKFGVMRADEVASAILDGALRNKYVILPGTGNRLLYFLVGMLGNWIYPMVDGQWADARRKHPRK